MKKQQVAVSGSILTVTYPTIGKKFSFDTAGYKAEIQVAARMHGYKQKFGDAASGKSPTEKFAEVQEIHKSLLSGEWERTATPDFTPLILQAVARIKGLKLDLDKRTLAKGNKVTSPNEETVKTWGLNNKVRAMMLKIRAERAAEAAADDEEEVEIEIE